MTRKESLIWQTCVLLYALAFGVGVAGCIFWSALAALEWQANTVGEALKHLIGGVSGGMGALFLFDSFRDGRAELPQGSCHAIACQSKIGFGAIQAAYQRAQSEEVADECTS